LAHIGRGKQISVFAFLDALAQQPGRAERAADRGGRLLLVTIADCGHHLAQAAGGKHMHRVRRGRAGHQCKAKQREQQQTACAHGDQSS
jgi:hypothetical protein